MEINNQIQEIKSYMKANRITYDELSERSGLSISTIKKIFSGISQYPRIDTMETIRRALGIEEQPSEYSEEEKRLLSLISELTDEEAQELSNYIDFIISKRK